MVFFSAFFNLKPAGVSDSTDFFVSVHTKNIYMIAVENNHKQNLANLSKA